MIDVTEDRGNWLGLGDLPRKDWEAPIASRPGELPIDMLRPNSEAHKRVLDYLVERINCSEREMSNFYARWRINEIKHQAYINLPDWENALKEAQNDKGKPPAAVRIIVPTMFSMMTTIVTYLLHTFAGRKPMWQVSTYDLANGDRARAMEIKLQYDSDHTRAIRELHQGFQDAQNYGVFVLRVEFQKEQALRTVRQVIPRFDALGRPGTPYEEAYREMQTVYEGSKIKAIDPFMFFPDPRVPMTEVSERGEFVFWRTFEGRHHLLSEQARGTLKWVKEASTKMPEPHFSGDDSARGMRAGGRPVAGINFRSEASFRQFYQVDQGTCEIIPRELGLSESENPEKWLFTILNKNQIVQAIPFEADHGRHPVVVSEPYSTGYSFGSLAIADYLGPLQDVSSWLVNSHIDNVRKVLNDMLIVDPSMIEMQDLKNPEPGKLIRLKRSALGQDVRQAVYQLAVQDVTKQNINDLDAFGRIMQQLSAVNENMMGIQDSGGRKTATEVRTSAESAVSRLAAQTRIISAQAICSMTEMMALNNIQYLSAPFFLSVVGKDGMNKSIWITPEMLVGDFYYPVHDGTLPMDRVAMLDIWREILTGVLADPELRANFDVTKMFTYVAELGGAKNVEGMRRALQNASIQGLPPGMIDAGVKSGNMAPLPPPPGIAERQGNRALQGLPS